MVKNDLKFSIIFTFCTPHKNLINSEFRCVILLAQNSQIEIFFKKLQNYYNFSIIFQLFLFFDKNCTKFIIFLHIKYHFKYPKT